MSETRKGEKKKPQGLAIDLALHRRSLVIVPSAGGVRMDGPVFCFVFESRLEGKVGGEKIEQEFADAVASWLSVPRSGKKVLWFSLSFFLSFGFFFFLCAGVGYCCARVCVLEGRE